MPFTLSGNLNRVDELKMLEFQKKFGIILSAKQFPKQQYSMILTSLKTKMNFVDTFSSFTKDEVVSFVFLLSQFSDTTLDETPYEYSFYKNNPYIIEWQKNSYMIPFEVLDYIAAEKIFKDQNYLFSLITHIPPKEKKSWLKWLNIIYEGESEKEMNHEIYNKCRILQKPYLGKSFIQEDNFSIEKLWPRGSNKYIDWYYKGISNFYFSLQELSRVEKDPFFIRVIDEIKSGKLVIKKNKVNYGEPDSYKLVSTIEGKTLQLRNILFFWEQNHHSKEENLFNIS